MITQVIGCQDDDGDERGDPANDKSEDKDADDSQHNGNDMDDCRPGCEWRHVDTKS